MTEKNIKMDNFCYKCGSRLNEQGLCPNCDIKKSSKIKNVIICGVIVLIIALIVSAVYYVLENNIAPFNNKQNIRSTSHYYSISNGNNNVENRDTNTTVTERMITTECTTVTESETHITNSADNDFLFPSDTELLTKEYLDTKSKNEIDLIRNEIYARHGYIFKMEQYYDYFIEKNWYNPTEPDMEKAYENFNSIEKQNIEILVEYQNLG